MLLWNYVYPFDAWWRANYNVPFGSPQHQQMTFSDIVFERCQFLEFDPRARRPEDEFDGQLISYTDTDGKKVEYQTPDAQELKKLRLTQSQIEQAFESLDLSKFNDKPENTVTLK